MKKKKKVRLCSSFGSGSLKTMNLSRILPCGVQTLYLWFVIPIIGLRSVTYTFGLRFTYKRWVRVLSKICILAFLGNYSNTICWVSKRID